MMDVMARLRKAQAKTEKEGGYPGYFKQSNVYAERAIVQELIDEYEKLKRDHHPTAVEALRPDGPGLTRDLRNYEAE